MRIIISRKLLDRELSKVAKPVTSNAVLPSLTGILFEVDSDKITMMGSNGNVTIKTAIERSNDLEIIETGSIVIPVKYLIEIIKKIDTDKINIELFEDSMIKITNEKSDFTIMGMDSREYPEYNFDKTGEKVTLNADDICDIDDQVAFAVSPRDERPILKGVNFASSGNLVATATDSFRLARKVISAHLANFNITIPRPTIQYVAKNVTNEKEIEMYINEKTVLFDFGNTQIWSKILVGQFPETSRLIPTEFNAEVVVSKDELLGAVQRVILVSSEQKNIVKITIDKTEFKLQSKVSEIGAGVEVINDYKLEGQSFIISANAQYIIDALKQFKEEKIKIRFIHDLKPFIITAVDSYDNIQLIVPFRTY